MLSIRLSRVGKNKQPSYRVVISEKHKDTQGNCLEFLGFYNPRTEPKTVRLKEDRIKYWLSKGAQASPTVHNLLVDAGVVGGAKIKATRAKKKVKKGDEDVKTENSHPAGGPPKGDKLKTEETKEKVKEKKEEVKTD